ncbi:MAG: hypothetical protein M3450_19160 [Actinomycetota bacterium]|nr:hypothetical protein [Actinomycetota bacterium]
MLELYRDALKERWNMITAVEKLGVGTLRADWVDDELARDRGKALGRTQSSSDRHRPI